MPVINSLPIEIIPYESYFYMDPYLEYVKGEINMLCS